MIPLLLALGCAAPLDEEDADHDGFVAADDCDEDDALVYPGAPDAPADGVDADCDGVDPAHAFVGDWQLVQVSATWSGLQAFDPGTESGLLVIEEGMAASLNMSVGLDPDLVGGELQIEILMEGEASAVPGEGASWVWLEGDLYGEQAQAEWECAAGEEAMHCEGLIKALEVNFDTLLDFERG